MTEHFAFPFPVADKVRELLGSKITRELLMHLHFDDGHRYSYMLSGSKRQARYIRQGNYCELHWGHEFDTWMACEVDMDTGEWKIVATSDNPDGPS